METRKSLAFSTDEQVQELFSSSRGKTLDAILEHLLPDFHELSQLKHFNNLLATLYINGKSVKYSLWNLSIADHSRPNSKEAYPRQNF